MKTTRRHPDVLRYEQALGPCTCETLGVCPVCSAVADTERPGATYNATAAWFTYSDERERRRESCG